MHNQHVYGLYSYSTYGNTSTVRTDIPLRYLDTYTSIVSRDNPFLSFLKMPIDCEFLINIGRLFQISHPLNLIKHYFFQLFDMKK